MRWMCRSRDCCSDVGLAEKVNWRGKERVVKGGAV
jgi:hypothetical protein